MMRLIYHNNNNKQLPSLRKLLFLLLCCSVLVSFRYDIIRTTTSTKSNLNLYRFLPPESSSSSVSEPVAATYYNSSSKDNNNNNNNIIEAISINRKNISFHVDRNGDDALTTENNDIKRTTADLLVVVEGEEEIEEVLQQKKDQIQIQDKKNDRSTILDKHISASTTSVSSKNKISTIDHDDNKEEEENDTTTKHFVADKFYTPNNTDDDDPRVTTTNKKKETPVKKDGSKDLLVRTTASHKISNNNNTTKDTTANSSIANANNTASSSSSNHNISIVVQLGGDMGNQLSYVAFAYTIQLDLKTKYNLTSHLVLKHQDSTKWISSKRNVQQCFPYFRYQNFSAGNIPEFDLLLKQQQQFLGQENAALLINPTDEGLKYLNKILLQSSSDDDDDGNNLYPTTLPKPANSTNIDETTTRAITFPFILTSEMADHAQIDKYYHQIRTLYKFDYTNCCAQVPDPDEAVFHFRNFLTELPKVGQKMGFTELSPNTTAYGLFGHLKSGSRIAIATRYMKNKNNTSIEGYIEAFTQRGLSVRLTSNGNKSQTGAQDFCFLLTSQSDLGGSGVSTFYKWAVWLSNNTQKTNWIYYLDNKYTLRNKQHHEFYYNWTYHPELRSTIRCKTFKE